MFRLALIATLVVSMPGPIRLPPASRQAAATQDQALLATSMSYEFPTADAQVWGLVATGARERLLARALVNEPASVETLRVLMGRRRFDEALKVLRAIIDARPEQMAAAFSALSSNSREMLADGARNFRDPIRSLVADARQRATTLRREPSAQVARALVNIETELALSQASRNPILPGWYADPEARVFGNQYWIYPTYSAPYGQQTFLDAFSSNDLVTWTKHSRVLDVSSVKWAKRALWAPSVVEKDGWYYLFFGANDIQNDDQLGGIGVARARRPEGPFEDYLGRPLIGKFYNGAQPIDQFVFEDRDGAYYIVYGGWRHCNIARLNDDFTGFIPFPDGTTFKEITPEGYVEGAFMLLKDGKYYFMWSEGGWTGPNYAVAYAVGSSPFGPFTRVAKILQQDPSVATGAGHHSVLRAPASGKWYIVYHRRPIGETDRNHRVVCIDELQFDENGLIVPVVITKTGVAPDPIR